MAAQRVAVIGAGACGMSMMKTLREDGFHVTCYERRKQVGRLWAYTDDPLMTTALPYYPSHLTASQFQEFMESYARHFDLLSGVVFGASVTRATRNDDDTRWKLEMLVEGKTRSEEFDKVVFCHGYQTQPTMPKFEGQELFKGTLMHAQQFRRQVQVPVRRCRG
ncbi:hypothetical protein BCR34DRAFT_594369 [Clohesyomyces aquaticus]|uniref:Flavin-containing monooxygenase n=1 Tax=Clohesyomyces aquaticus TaxID=1231657 RepID=A0A1Y1Y9D7_9PLEO|nr:hypothetical protein BCR34DRAFT_594369 [Clohesyomyces aquaticus]